MIANESLGRHELTDTLGKLDTLDTIDEELAAFAREALSDQTD